MNYADDERYRRIHFAVMAIESGARKLGISGKEMHDRLQKQGLTHRHAERRRCWAKPDIGLVNENR